MGDIIRVYVERLEKPLDIEKENQRISQRAAELGVPDFITRSSTTTGKYPSVDDLASNFDPGVLHILWAAKSIAQDLNCNYEFIDVVKGDILEVDDDFPPVKYVRTIGKHTVTEKEKNLPIPCCVIRDQQLELLPKTDGIGGPQFPDIRGFYHRVTGVPDTRKGRGYSLKERMQRMDSEDILLGLASKQAELVEREKIYTQLEEIAKIEKADLRWDLMCDLFSDEKERNYENLAKGEMSKISEDSVTCPKCGDIFTPIGSMIKPDGSIMCSKCFTRFKK